MLAIQTLSRTRRQEHEVPGGHLGQAALDADDASADAFASSGDGDCGRIRRRQVQRLHALYRYAGETLERVSPNKRRPRQGDQAVRKYILNDEHPLVTDLTEVCSACKTRFKAGDTITLVSLGPGDSEEGRKRAREGRAYNAVTVPVHYACATGEDPEGQVE